MKKDETTQKIYKQMSDMLYKIVGYLDDSQLACLGGCTAKDIDKNTNLYMLFHAGLVCSGTKHFKHFYHDITIYEHTFSVDQFSCVMDLSMLPHIMCKYEKLLHLGPKTCFRL